MVLDQGNSVGERVHRLYDGGKARRFFRFLIDVDPDVDPEMNRHYEARNRQCLS